MRRVGGDSGSGGVGGGDSEERGTRLLQERNYVSDNVPQSINLSETLATVDLLCCSGWHLDLFQPSHDVSLSGLPAQSSAASA